MPWLSRMFEKTNFSVFLTEAAVSWRHALEIMFLCKQSLHVRESNMYSRLCFGSDIGLNSAYITKEFKGSDP